ncbi:pheromone-regulated membrane [Cordyceps militaris]|uniref:Pheromone-regulated membrane n=1 Tax=Cordyceps militaris TaxID=73501 RepID=A0A2H4S723_CORMI|nr:pheromone-regulated membrane [Cordyceps militaris]
MLIFFFFFTFSSSFMFPSVFAPWVAYPRPGIDVSKQSTGDGWEMRCRNGKRPVGSPLTAGTPTANPLQKRRYDKAAARARALNRPGANQQLKPLTGPDWCTSTPTFELWMDDPGPVEVTVASARHTREFAEQKWDYINLKDFKATGCGTPFAYGYLWFSLILSIAVYSIDSFTAVQLIAFNRWSSAIRPAISFDVSKWIFFICIILSFINLGYEGIRATRVIKRNNIAESYLDPLAVRWESIRVGKAQGWRRFLVFAALTQTWIRVLVCSGPRQVINAFTLKSVYEAKLATKATSVDGAFLGFFDKVKVLAQEDYRQAVILSGMAFTFVIWAFALIFLLLAVLFYVFFLFHWIPRADGGLTGYCERKINAALLTIVTKRVNKALAKGEAKKFKAEAKAAKMTGETLQPERAATLPDFVALADDKLQGMPILNRSDTGNTLPPYQTRPNTPGGIELSSINRPAFARSETNGSSYSPTVPLMSAAADMGYGPVSTQPPMPPPQRPGTAMSQRSQVSAMAPLQRPGTATSQRGIAMGVIQQRPGTANSQHSQAPRPGTGNQYPYSNTSAHMPVVGEEPYQGLGQPTLPQLSIAGPTARYGLGPSNSQRSVGSSQDGSERGFRQGVGNATTQAQSTQRQFQPYNPNSSARQQGPPTANLYSAEQYGNPIHPPVRSATAASAPPGGPMYSPQRSVTAPVPSRAATTDPYIQRGLPPQNSSFAPIQRSNTSDEFANGVWVPPSQRNRSGPQPGNGGWVSPSQRNTPPAYDLEAQYKDGQRNQY